VPSSITMLEATICNVSMVKSYLKQDENGNMRLKILILFSILMMV